ncbi:MAG: SDR family NAD(P)-dependent oxidoreductase, partial [Gillisia sp.]
MKHVVITGTSRGIGLELVKIFAEKGDQVIAISRNIQQVEALQLKNVIPFACDLTNSEDLEKLTSYLQKKGQNVDVLINNAGTIVNKPFSETSTEEFKNVFNTNVFAVAAIIKSMLPFMNKGSHVVNISSMGGIQGSAKFAGLSAYSSS